jgi:hypothetical protein
MARSWIGVGVEYPADEIPAFMRGLKANELKFTKGPFGVELSQGEPQPARFRFGLS